ncbi:MAG: DUF4340 domain-containing protein [Gemmatimonadetes bacterium]|nr:DUF4340 domain-containing protein [Gemmatimonadota bacterium]
MSTRTLAIVLGSLVALLALYGIVRLVDSRGAPASDGATALADVLAEVDPGGVSSMEITGGAVPITLQRGSTGWTANGFAADTVAVRQLIEALTDVSVGALVSSNPGNHDRLGVAGANARQLQVTGEGGAQVTIAVGRPAPGGGTYVRLPSSDQVFLLSSGLRIAAELGGGLGRWRDRTLAQVDTAQVSRIAIERDGSWTELVRTDGGWTVEGRPTTVLPVRDLLGGLVNLVAMDFAPDSVSLAATRRVVALGAQGDTLAAIEMGGPSDVGRVPARARGVEETFQLTNFDADRVTPTRAAITGSG